MLSSGSSRLSVAYNVPSTLTQQLNWKVGTPYPIVNGETIYPPLAVVVNPDPQILSGSYHWWAGGSFNGSSANASSVFTQIKVDGKEPKSSQFYYVLASLWDNKLSYDQIGYSNDNGVWGLTYSYTTGTCSELSFHYNPDAMNLTTNTIYKFYIMTTSTGKLEFQAFAGGVEVWHLNVNTGATSLSISTLGCDNMYYGYTVYEEVYSSSANGVPNFNFNFQKNTFQELTTGKWVHSSWEEFTTSGTPSKVSISISGSSVLIHN
jgi:hypothetical protein